jgi:hypothetical protein
MTTFCLKVLLNKMQAWNLKLTKTELFSNFIFTKAYQTDRTLSKLGMILGSNDNVWKSHFATDLLRN